MSQVDCQVVERKVDWPYVFPCTKLATHQIRHWVRQNNPEIDVEYICEDHAEKCLEAFGPTSLDRI